MLNAYVPGAYRYYYGDVASGVLGDGRCAMTLSFVALDDTSVYSATTTLRCVEAALSARAGILMALQFLPVLVLAGVCG